MGVLSIRGVDEQLSTLLKQQANVSKKSVNQFILEILRRQVGLDKVKRFTREYDNLDNLFGKWSAREFNQIQGKIDEERKLDAELWK